MTRRLITPAVLDVRYQRMTLVARAGGERMTIDTDLCFQSENRTLQPAPVCSLSRPTANGRAGYGPSASHQRGTA
jgi:hypothetical protein